MQKNCPICGKTIRISEVKVSCVDCQLRCHLNCLDSCELYRTLQHKDYIKEDQRSTLNSTIPIRCVGCLKKGPKQKLVCSLNPVDFDTFYVPVKLKDTKEQDSPAIVLSRSASPKTGQVLGKRQSGSQAADQDQVTREALESTLQNQIINDYISVNVLIELQNHGRTFTFSRQELVYQFSRELLDKYKSFKCMCGLSCAFSCAYCHLSRANHRDCLEKLDTVPEFSLHCIDCYPKNARRAKKKEPKKSKNEDEETEPKIKEQKSKTIRLRRSQNILFNLLDGVVSSLNSKKLMVDVLR